MNINGNEYYPAAESRGVEPAKLVEAVRLLVIRQQGQNHMTGDDIPAKLDPEVPQQAIVAALLKYGK